MCALMDDVIGWMGFCVEGVFYFEIYIQKVLTLSQTTGRLRTSLEWIHRAGRYFTEEASPSGLAA